MKLTLIRHGQTNYNLKDLCNGRPNSKVYLTSLGKKQAQSAAKKLSKEKFEVIFISELRRSRQTAEIINQYHKVPLIKDKRLNDRSMGEFEGRPATLFYIWRDAHKNRWTCRPKGGESYEDMKERVNNFLKDLAKKKYKKVLIVSHLPILKVMRGHFKKLSNAAMDKLTEKQVPNAKIFRFDFKIKKA
jgi:broad specificity phosphatase PhoE